MDGLTRKAISAAAALASTLLPALAGEPDRDTGSANDTGQTKRYAVTEFSANFMREEPDFQNELGNQVLMGTPVEIVGQKGYWKQVVSPEPYKAWCIEMGLVEMSGREMEEYIAAPKHIVTAEYSRVFGEPDFSSARISDLVAGDLLRTVEETSRKNGKKGFVHVMLPSGATGYVPAEDVEAFSSWAFASKATPESIISAAMLFSGVPYMWGGTSVKGVDCSGLVRMVWFMNGVLVPRNASAQAASGRKVEVPLRTGEDGLPAQEEVSSEEMRERIRFLSPGDLVFFGKYPRVSHVGIYIGNGKFIHASQKVRINSLLPGDGDYYPGSGMMHSARRFIGEEDKGTGITRIASSPYYFPEKS